MDTNISALIYRVATLSETNMVAELAEFTFRESWSEEGNESDMNEYVNEHFIEDKIEKELKDSTVIYMLACSGPYAIGYAKLERNLQPANYDLEQPLAISRIYVRKYFQGKQVGSQLLKQTFEIATNENFKSVWLGVWNENMAAIRLYERFGFYRFGTYQFIMGSIVSDDYLMMKKI